MTQIRLSFCIATRNRAGYIAETLRSIAGQATNEVEIVVIDGASTDDTREVVAGIQAEFPCLRYARLEENGGVDRDYDAAVAHARGEYCWLMSDDDVLVPGAVKRVLDAINHGYCLIVVNAELRNLDLSELIDSSRLRFDSDRVYNAHEFDRLFAETSAYLTYIGAVVIRREVWMARDRASHYGSYFIHVGVIFQHPLPGPTLVIADPLISIRFGNTQWRPKEFEIRMIRWTDLVASLDAVRGDVRRRQYPVAPWLSSKSLFFYRAKGTYGLDQYRQWVRPRVQTLRDRGRGYAIACFPGVLANLIGMLYCRLPYRDANVHLLDMKASRFFYRHWFKNALGKP